MPTRYILFAYPDPDSAALTELPRLQSPGSELGAHPSDITGLNIPVQQFSKFGPFTTEDAAKATQVLSRRTLTFQLVKNKGADGKSLARIITDGTSGNVTAIRFIPYIPSAIQVRPLTPTGVGTGDQVGYSVAIDGDTIVVGSPGDDDYGLNAGAVYIYHRESDGTYTETKLTAPDPRSGDKFGWSVAIGGDTIVVGAPNAKDYGTGGSVTGSGSENAGKIYIFRRASDGTYTVLPGAGGHPLNHITANDGVTELNAYAYFGYSVAIDGDTVVAGARHGYNGNASFESEGKGAVYVYHRESDGTYNAQVLLEASDAADDDRFGHSVAIDGDTIVVGAIGDDDVASGSGSVYVFRMPDGGTTYSQVQKLTASDAVQFDSFGWSVAIEDGTIMVGAIGNGGTAYVFHI